MVLVSGTGGAADEWNVVVDAADPAAALKPSASAGEHGPYVLVGASWGAMITALYARTHPEQASGLVTVDGASVILRDTLSPAQWSDWMRKIAATVDPRRVPRFPTTPGASTKFRPRPRRPGRCPPPCSPQTTHGTSRSVTPGPPGLRGSPHRIVLQANSAPATSPTPPAGTASQSSSPDSSPTPFARWSTKRAASAVTTYVHRVGDTPSNVPE